VRNQILASVLVSTFCLASGFAETIAKNPFTPEIRLELSPCSLPCAQLTGTMVVSQTRSAEHLQLARIYADANRIEAAVAEYAKIMDSDDAKMRATALASNPNLLRSHLRLVAEGDGKGGSTKLEQLEIASQVQTGRAELSVDANRPAPQSSRL